MTDPLFLLNHLVLAVNFIKNDKTAFKPASEFDVMVQLFEVYFWVNSAFYQLERHNVRLIVLNGIFICRFDLTATVD